METIIEWFKGVDHVMQAFYATLFTWGVTALGAALVYFFKTINRNVDIQDI